MMLCVIAEALGFDGMPCYNPLKAYDSRVIGSTGNPIATFNPRYADSDLIRELPCGQCIGCRLERSRQWAVRIMHEASLYDHNAFVTLTYDADNVPSDYSLDKTHFQKFIKRLRDRTGYKLRYYHCGEYGDENFRPHYHACLFNINFPNPEFLCSIRGNVQYTFPLLSQCWKFGRCSFGDLNFESAAYVSRYCVKKVNGEQAKQHYRRDIIDTNTGESFTVDVIPEYATMSLKPGIGQRWFDKYHTDVYPNDLVISRGHRAKPPRYYDKLLAKMDAPMLDDVKFARQQEAIRHIANNTDDRLIVRQHIKESQISTLTRKL